GIVRRSAPLVASKTWTAPAPAPPRSLNGAPTTSVSPASASAQPKRSSADAVGFAIVRSSVPDVASKRWTAPIGDPVLAWGASTVRDGTNSSACAGRPRSPSATATRTARRVGLPLTPPTSLPDDVDQIAEQRVARGDHPRVRLERALRADQVDELLGDLHVR